ncbi:MAG: DUF5702 domain-containing protein [Clostridiales Family XIII bacterium]|jgi:hypothetical protein|nr:DUF5702 domain-containing protein [Clostridiales Family XIII bacterium]
MAFTKRGSTSVFLTLIFASLIIVASVLIRAAGLSAGRSYGDAVFNMAGRSLLSEYDQKLFEDYGIFGMRSDEEDARRKLLHYSDASLERRTGMGGAVWVLPCSVRDLTTDLNEFSLLDVDVFEKQILGDAKNIIVNRAADMLLSGSGGSGASAGGASGSGGSGGSAGGASGSGGSGASAGGAAGSEGAGDSAAGPRGVVGELGNGAIINALPSQGVSGGGLPIQTMIDNGLPSAEELLGSGSDTLLVTEYLLSRFTCAKTPVPKLASDHSHFFANEVEYIIAGEHSDSKNYSSVKTRLALLRFVMNEIHIHSNSEKMNTVTSIQTALSAVVPPPWPQVLRELIIALWVTAETDNDMELLARGRRVPLVKSKENWACGAGGIAEKVLAHINATGPGRPNAEEAPPPEPIAPEKEEGFLYVDYLRLFLYFVPRDVKLLRTMDLIQLNLKSSYYDSFLIRDHYTGIRYSLYMNGDRFEYTHTYAKQDGSEGHE